MNKRIRELEKLATETVKCGINGTSTAESFSRKKFAELIVRECADLLELEYGQSVLTGNKAAESVKKHFGVEE